MGNCYCKNDGASKQGEKLPDQLMEGSMRLRRGGTMSGGKSWPPNQPPAMAKGSTASTVKRMRWNVSLTWMPNWAKIEEAVSVAAASPWYRNWTMSSKLAKMPTISPCLMPLLVLDPPI